MGTQRQIIRGFLFCLPIIMTMKLRPIPMTEQPPIPIHKGLAFMSAECDVRARPLHRERDCGDTI